MPLKLWITKFFHPQNLQRITTQILSFQYLNERDLSHSQTSLSILVSKGAKFTYVTRELAFENQVYVVTCELSNVHNDMMFMVKPTIYKYLDQTTYVETSALNL